MEGIKEKQELSNEFNHPVKNEIKEEKLGPGFQSLDFADQTLDHQLLGDQNDGLTKKLSEMTIEGLSGEEEDSELVFAIEIDEKKSEIEGVFDKDGNFGEEIVGENDQGDFGGFKDSGVDNKGKIEEKKPDKWSVVEGNEGDFEGVKEGGGDELGSKLCENENRAGDRDLEGFFNDEAKIDERKSGKFGVVKGNEGDSDGVKEGSGNKEGSKWYENENRGGDHDLEGFINDEAKIEERRSGKFSVVEGNEGDFKEMKQGGKDKEGSKWSEIENEGDDRDLEGIKDEAEIEERNPEKFSVVEGNEGDFKEMKQGGKDKEGSKWSEIENEGGDRDLESIKYEAEIEERNPEKRSVVEGNEGAFKEMNKGGKDKEGSKWNEIENEGGDRDLEGIKDEAEIEERNPEKRSVVEGNEGAFKEMKEGGKYKEGSKLSEIENEGGDRDLEGIKDEAEIEERNPEKRSVVEGNEGAFKEMKEGGKYKEGSKLSEIENEGGDRDLEGINDEAEIEERNPEKRSVVEGNEGAFKKMKEEGNDKKGSKWSEIEDVEENNNLEVKDKRIGKGKEVIEDYEEGWGENWDDGAGRTVVNEEQQYFDNYEDERNVYEQYGEAPHWYGNAEGDVVGRNGKAQYDKEPHWYGNAEKDSVGLNDGNFGSYHYPLRPPDAEDCSFYMRTGTCKFGLNCKFNHPLKRKNQAARDTFKQKEEIYDMPRQTECKYYSSSGGCKYGKACRYNHGKGKAAVTPNLELNFLGLPIRVGEKECSFYMRTGSCKYGSNCRFHHPDPTVAGGGDTTSPGRGSTSARTLNETAPFRPIYPPTPSAPPNAEWNGYQAPAYGTSQRNLPIPPAFSMNIPATGSSFYAHPRSQMIVDEFPERPGQPECNFYLKTGDCKYRSSCKFHHPKNPKTSVTLSDQGLPLRPGHRVCSHFSRYGICKFGPSCKYDHSVGGTAASSDGSDQGRPFQFTCFPDEYGEWEMEPMGSA